MRLGPRIIHFSAQQPGKRPVPHGPSTTTYDALGRPTQVTDGGGGTLTYTYSGNDADRVVGPSPAGENTKRKQFDAQVRLTSVCEVTSLTGGGTCGQNSTQTGHWTRYTYYANSKLIGVTQDAQSIDEASFQGHVGGLKDPTQLGLVGQQDTHVLLIIGVNTSP